MTFNELAIPSTATPTDGAVVILFDHADNDGGDDGDDVRVTVQRCCSRHPDKLDLAINHPITGAVWSPLTVSVQRPTPWLFKYLTDNHPNLVMDLNEDPTDPEAHAVVLLTDAGGNTRRVCCYVDDNPTIERLVKNACDEDVWDVCLDPEAVLAGVCAAIARLHPGETIILPVDADLSS